MFKTISSGIFDTTLLAYLFLSSRSLSFPDFLDRLIFRSCTTSSSRHSWTYTTRGDASGRDRTMCSCAVRSTEWVRQTRNVIVSTANRQAGSCTPRLLSLFSFPFHSTTTESTARLPHRMHNTLSTPTRHPVYVGCRRWRKRERDKETRRFIRIYFMPR